MIQIPKRLQDKLDDDKNLRGLIDINLNAFNTWYKISRTPFFPEFTDHGPDHVSDVLKTASSLVRDEAWDIFTPADATVMIIATVLHDCAMHLTEDGLLDLIIPKTPKKIIEGFGDREWSLLWEDFWSEASRFDGRTLNRLFGETTPVHRPPDNTSDWTDRHKRAIGEFVRRHHPRLAHEIALFGVPGPSTEPIVLKSVPHYLVDLSGLVARSHGLPIRAGADYLLKNESYKDACEYKDIHAIFLMGLLRVADYLQVQAERAAQEKLQITNLKSPISQMEFRKHQAIKDVRYTHPDPEAVYVDARPEDVQTYLELKKLLASIQSELDTTWAAFGEVYGRYNSPKSLNKFGLAIRRVRSRLDNIREYAETVDYIPQQAAFEAVNPDLIKLMIKPLYGDSPEYGVRELIQNAVDAVREMKDLCSRERHLSPQFPEFDADVRVELEKRGDDAFWISVRDKGMGMTNEIIINYFLKAGASYRRSDAWRKEFEVEPYKARVLRTGRFGVGALATFLLGSELHVTTRHVNMPENEGIQFSATLDTESIELKRCKSPVGTTISVKISEQTYNRLSQNLSNWDWFCLAWPKVERVVISTQTRAKQDFSIPGQEETAPKGWRCIHNWNTSELRWTYTQPSPALALNGFLIKRGMSGISFDRSFPFVVPRIALFDRDGTTAVNLQRTEVRWSEMQGIEELQNDILKDFLGYVLRSGLNEVPLISEWFSLPLYPGIREEMVEKDSDDFVASSWLTCKNGFTILGHGLLSDADIETLLLLPFDRQGGSPIDIHSARKNVGVVRFRHVSVDMKNWVSFLARGVGFNTEISDVELSEPTGRRVLVPRYLMEEEEFFRDLLDIEGGIEDELGDWCVWRVGECASPTVRFESLARRLPEPDEYDTIGPIAEWHYVKTKIEDETRKTLLGKAWIRYIKRVFLPFDFEKRNEIWH